MQGMGRQTREVQVWPLVFLSAFAAGSAEAATPELIDQAQLGEAVRTELNRRLAERESLPPGVFVADDRQLVVQLDPGPMPGSDDVLIHVLLMYAGEQLDESTTESCIACTGADVGNIVMVLVEPLLHELPGPSITEAPVPVGPEPDALELRPSTRQPANGCLVGGTVLLGAGLAGLGVGFIVADERVASPPTALYDDVVKYCDPRLAIAVMSGAAVLTGAVLLGLGARRGRRSQLVRRAMLGPRGVRLTLVGRFR